MDAFITRRGGAGAGLNFKVVGGTTQPENPKENTIWINTSTEITSWVFDSNEPTNPVTGMVWITNGTLSNVEINCIKDNAVMVYPLSTKQYIDAWSDVPALIYMDGKWSEFGKFFYHPTNQYIGQWIPTAYKPSGSVSTPVKHNIEFSDGELRYVGAGSGTGMIYNDTLIDFSGLTKLTAVVSNDGNSYVLPYMIVTDQIKEGYTSIAEKSFNASGNTETIEIPLTNINIKGYIAFRLYSNMAGKGATIKSVKVE